MHFPSLYWLKKIGKWPFLDQNHELTPLKNVNFLTFWASCFYSLKRRFIVLEYHKRHFPGLYCLNKKSWKNGHFWTKTMGYSLWKNVNFPFFWTSSFYSLERRFIILEYHKRHFSGLYCLKKKLEKWPFLDQNHGLTPLEKCQFFAFLDFLFL